jgi:hypothetical protein|tara:strand:- start:12 stop:1739 length:1728 start_codon:yes stop_codon:yes gene_type:complete
MKKAILIVVLGFFFCSISFAAERSEIEIKNGVFIEDVEEFGTFNKINTAPAGMFKARDDQFIKMSKYSQEKIGLIFVQQKGILDKYPENLMLGMGYFEFFYMEQLKKHKKDIIVFKETHPNIKGYIRTNIKKIYGLNKARKTMRNALGFTLEDDVQEVLQTYYVLSKLFAKGEKTTIKLNNEEKKLFKSHLKLAKNLGIVKSLVKDKNEQRIDDKKFKKKYLKAVKKVNIEIKKLDAYDNYNQLGKFLDITQEIELSESSALLSSYNLADFLLAQIKNKDVKKRFKIDLTNADFSNFKEKEIELLGEASKTTKIVKAKKSNKIQLDILNLENNNVPINEILDEFRENSLDLSSINFQMESTNKMNLWARKDWANAWKTPIPKKIEDISQGIMIDLSQEDVESIKAQLSIEHYKDLLNLDMAKELNDNLKDMKSSIDASSFNFSYGLDNYAQFLGDIMNLDIKNYSDLTDLANATHNANWSVEEYASAYQFNVDAINALASGTSSFDVGQMAQSIGASLQDAADTIAAASAAGVSVDLEAAAAGLGYGSFADAVSAYNAAHGTSYTEAQAKEALGQ